MKKLMLATVAIIAASTATLAADLPQRQFAPAPVVAPPIFTWSGFYAGVHAGAIWGRSDMDFAGGSAGAVAAVNNSTLPRSLDLDGNGFIGGGQIGYNAQFGSFVVGVEGDLSYVNVDESASFSATFGRTIPGDPPTFIDVTQVTTGRNEIDWLGTLRARLGYGAGRFMPYVTGGLAFGKVESSVTVATNPGSTVSASEDETMTGWTVGGGVEYAFTDKLLFRTEYLYYDLGGHSVTVTSAGGIDATYDFEKKGHIARAGLNYKF